MPRDATTTPPPLAQPRPPASSNLATGTTIRETAPLGLVPAQVVLTAPARPSLAQVSPTASDSRDESALGADSLEVLRLYVERMRRMVHSVSPGTVAPTARVLFDIYRLESGQSTANTAVHLTSEDRRARILELAEVVAKLDEVDG